MNFEASLAKKTMAPWNKWKVREPSNRQNEITNSQVFRFTHLDPTSGIVQ